MILAWLVLMLGCFVGFMFAAAMVTQAQAARAHAWLIPSALLLIVFGYGITASIEQMKAVSAEQFDGR